MLLAGDIGGTKTNLAIYSPEAGPRTPVLEKTFRSASYPSLEALVSEFLAQASVQVDRACFGVAGPVIGDRAKITNLPWIMDEKQLQESLHLSSVSLLNDLDAMAHAIPYLELSDLLTLNLGNPDAHGTLAIIAPGTGLGEAYVTWEGTRYQAHASEGGHTDFAPTNLLEIELLRFLMTRLEHVSYEYVCSGIGIPNLYAYFKEGAAMEEPPWLKEQLAATSDKTPIIVGAALNKEQSAAICVATLQTFVSILGAEAGNLALKVLATGGVYLGGGIPLRILPFLKDEAFMAVFRRKGRFADLLMNVPVHIVTNPNLALLGAAYHGFEM